MRAVHLGYPRDFAERISIWWCRRPNIRCRTRPTSCAFPSRSARSRSTRKPGSAIAELRGLCPAPAAFSSSAGRHFTGNLPVNRDGRVASPAASITEAEWRLSARDRQPANARRAARSSASSELECSEGADFPGAPRRLALLSGDDRGGRRDLRDRRQRGDGRRRGEHAVSRSASSQLRRAPWAEPSWQSPTDCDPANGFVHATCAFSGQSLEEHGFGGTIDAPRASNPPDFTAEIAEPRQAAFEAAA